MRVDDINIGIIRQLKDGRKSFRSIAETLSVSENTVRTRVAKLIEEGVVDISARVDPEAFPQHRVVIVGVKL